ncbi:hypothetical protein C1I97_32490 [Streptomyces sp. NTH33]|uniref:hypothetical protein n=1 Tax=Streptomyces sp. NTH33 TaxID=1735453 RepID=UPI000DAAA9CD|nr:hypothetical protein [Streptomyces sp. NTH33]PZG87677.1 hypothetical protein C1I97_32490 [Streptomyces sp. NTH33]
MPEHVSLLMWFGVALPAALTVAAIIGMARIRRSLRLETAQQQHRAQRLTAFPQQLGAAPRRESVELSPAEEDAFAGLMRRLGDGS